MLKLSLILLSTVSLSNVYAEHQHDDDVIRRISPASERERAEKCKRALARDGEFKNYPSNDSFKPNPKKQMGGFPGPSRQMTEDIDDRQMGGVKPDPNAQQH